MANSPLANSEADQAAGRTVKIRRAIGSALLGVSVFSTVMGVATMEGGTSRAGTAAVSSEAPTFFGPKITIAPSVEKPKLTPKQEHLQPTGISPATEQTGRTTVLTTEFNPINGEGSISYATLQEANEAGINITPRILHDLTKYTQDYDNAARQAANLPTYADTQLPIGYTIHQPSTTELQAQASRLAIK